MILTEDYVYCDKLSSLQKIFDETEDRIDGLNERMDEISVTEERLQRLTEVAEEQINDFKVLGKVSTAKKKEGASSKKSMKAGSSSITPSLKESVRSLKEKGWTNEEIASSLRISEDTVDLILDVPSDDE